MSAVRAALVLAAAIAGCARPAPPRAEGRRLPPAAPATAPGCSWRYDVVALEGAHELAVEALVPPGHGELVVDAAGQFVRAVEVSTGGSFQRLEPDQPGSPDAAWRLPACPPAGCRVRYRFALADAARQVDTLACASEAGGAIVTAPSAWLLHPPSPAGGQLFELRVRTPPGSAFVAGFLPAAGEGYAADLTDLGRAPYAALGALRVRRVEVSGQAIDVALLPGELAAGEEELASAVGGAARAVRDYFGLTPIPRTLVIIAPGPGRGVGFARTMGNGGASIFLPVGRDTTAAELSRGWELVHELLHVAFPNLPNEQSWLEEGMATYLEPIVRARSGQLTAEEAFTRLHRRMAFGLPAEGDLGLDRTHTWARTYWGGALFCLVADVTIRERTGNRRSLDDALRAVLSAGGNVSERWDVEQVVAAGDAAIGVPVLAELYAAMGRAPGTVDLDGLWKRLGVVGHGEGQAVTFDERAPLASLRRAIMARLGP